MALLPLLFVPAAQSASNSTRVRAGCPRKNHNGIRMHRRGSGMEPMHNRLTGCHLGNDPPCIPNYGAKYQHPSWHCPSLSKLRYFLFYEFQKHLTTLSEGRREDSIPHCMLRVSVRAQEKTFSTKKIKASDVINSWLPERCQL